MRKYSTSYQKLFKATLAATVASGAFVSVATLSTHANEAGPALFKDLNEKAHYYGPVLNLSARGIVKGYSDGTYKPNNSVTRGQAAKILANTLGLDTVNVQNPGFTDVKVTDEYYGPIAALAQAGIINGYDDKTFRPNNKLKRSQMAKIITLGFGLEESALTDNRFTDVKSSDAYAGYVQALLTNNITTGTTAATFEPNALVTRGQIASFVVRSEAAVTVETTVDVTSEVVNITNNTVELANGKTYRLATTIKSLVNPSNLAVLKGATVNVTEQDGQIEKITSIEIAASGNDANHLVLDGKGAALTGDVKVYGDYVSIKNLVVEGNLEIGNNVKNSFLSDGITVKGKTIISDVGSATAAASNEGKMYRSIAFVKPLIAQTASEETTNKPVIVFSNSAMGTIEVSKNDVVIEATGTTNVQAFVVSASVHLKASEGVTIPQVTIAEGVTSITIDAPVTNLVINTQTDLKIEGTGDLGEITINSSNEVKFETTGKVDNVVIASKDSKVEFGANTKVGNLVLPEGVEAKDIIGNYEQVKGNIDTIGGDKKPEPSTPPTTQPTTPPSTGGGGETTTPQPDQGAIDRAAANRVITQIEALPEKVTVADEGKITAARTAYKGLTATQKGLVNNLQKLTAAEGVLAKLKQEATDKVAANKVNELINLLPESAAVTINDDRKIETAREAYKSLTATQQNIVSNLEKLVAAENALASLKQEASDKVAAKKVIDLINLLPEAVDVTINDDEKINTVIEEYNKLSDAQKTLVTDNSKEKLQAVENALLAIQREALFSVRIKDQLTGFTSDLLEYKYFDDATNQVTYEILDTERALEDIQKTGFLDKLLQVTEIKAIKIGSKTIELYAENGEQDEPVFLKSKIGSVVLTEIGKSPSGKMGDLVDQSLPVTLFVNDSGTEFTATYTFNFVTIESAVAEANEAINDLEASINDAKDNITALQDAINRAKEKVEVVRKLKEDHEELNGWLEAIDTHQIKVEELKVLVEAVQLTNSAVIALEDMVKEAANAVTARQHLEDVNEKVAKVESLDEDNLYEEEIAVWKVTVEAAELLVEQRELEEERTALIEEARIAVKTLESVVAAAENAADAELAVEAAQEKVDAVKGLEIEPDEMSAWEVIISEQRAVVVSMKKAEDDEKVLQDAIEAAQSAVTGLSALVKDASHSTIAKEAITAAEDMIDVVAALDSEYEGLESWRNNIKAQLFEVEKLELQESLDNEFTKLTETIQKQNATVKKIEALFDPITKEITITVFGNNRELSATNLFSGSGFEQAFGNLFQSQSVFKVSSSGMEILTFAADGETKRSKEAFVDEVTRLAIKWLPADSKGEKDLTMPVDQYLLDKEFDFVVYGKLSDGTEQPVKYVLKFK